MWILNSIPEWLPKLSRQMPAEVELCRARCNSDSDPRPTETNIEYVNSLLTSCRFLRDTSTYDEEIAVQVCIACFNASFGYEELAQQIRETAYIGGTSNWQSSTQYNKKAIGLLRFAASLPLLPTETLARCQQYTALFQLNQQLSMVLLSISKIRTRLYPDAKDKYSKLLSFQDSDINELSKVAIPYSKLAIGCADVCKSLQNSTTVTSVQLRTQIGSMQRFLDALALTLISMEKYDRANDPNMAAEMIDSAISKLKPVLLKDQLNMLQNNKSLEKLVLQTKLWKSSLKELVTKKKSNLRLHRSKESQESNSLHPFILEIIADFLVPLILVLKARYNNAAEFIFDNVGNPQQPLVLPQGNIPDVKGSRYYFDGSALCIDEESVSEMIR